MTFTLCSMFREVWFSSASRHYALLNYVLVGKLNLIKFYFPCSNSSECYKQKYAACTFISEIINLYRSISDNLVYFYHTFIIHYISPDTFGLLYNFNDEIQHQNICIENIFKQGGQRFLKSLNSLNCS